MNTFRSLEERLYEDRGKNIKAGLIEEVKKEIEIAEKEYHEILQKLKEKNYLTRDSVIKTPLSKFFKSFFPSILIELEGKDIYVLINSYKWSWSDTSFEGIAVSRNIMAYECKRSLEQELYKEILRCFKKHEDIGKKDLIILNIYSNDPSIIKKSFSEYIERLSAIWCHERLGHIELDRKLNVEKWESRMRYILDLLYEKAISHAERMMAAYIKHFSGEKVNGKEIEEAIKSRIILKEYEEKTIKIREYFDELSFYGEVYSHLTEFCYFFYKTYEGKFQVGKLLEYLQDERKLLEVLQQNLNELDKEIKIVRSTYYALKYLQESKIGKTIYEFLKNPDKFTNKDLENVTNSIVTERKRIEEELKDWLENELYKELVKIEKELKEME